MKKGRILTNPAFYLPEKLPSQRRPQRLCCEASKDAVFEENGYFSLYLNIFFKASSFNCKSPSGSGFSFWPPL